MGMSSDKVQCGHLEPSIHRPIIRYNDECDTLLRILLSTSHVNLIHDVILVLARDPAAARKLPCHRVSH